MSDEYPKVIQTGGITVTVPNAAEEARWRHAPLPGPAAIAPEPEVVEPVAAAPIAEPTPVVVAPKKKSPKKKPS